MIKEKYTAPDLKVVLYESTEELMAGGFEGSYVDPFASASSSISNGKGKQDWSPIDSLK